MTSFFPLLAQAAPSGGGSFMIIFYVLLFAAMWFLMIAPQRKKQKEHEKLVKELGKGDEIITNGGVIATIVAVKEDRLVIRTAEDTKMELGKTFVTQVLKKAGA